MGVPSVPAPSWRLVAVALGSSYDLIECKCAVADVDAKCKMQSDDEPVMVA